MLLLMLLSSKHNKTLLLSSKHNKMQPLNSKLNKMLLPPPLCSSNRDTMMPYKKEKSC